MTGRSLYGWRSIGERPFTSDELRGLELREIELATKARNCLRWFFMGLVLFTASLAAMNAYPLLAIAVLICSLFGMMYGLLGNRDFGRHHRAAKQDLSAGTVEEFESSNDLPQVVTSGSQRLIFGIDGIPKIPIYVDVVEVSEASSPVPYPTQLTEFDNRLAKKRTLSAGELEELRRASQRSYTAMLGQLLGALYFTSGGIRTLIPGAGATEVPALSLFYFLVAGLFWYRIWTGYRALATAASFGRDRKVGHVFIIDEVTDVFEILPESRIIWRQNGQPSEWRSHMAWNPSNMPVK